MKSIALVVLTALYCVATALCQTETATVSGRVTDPSGAVISAADVRVESVLTGYKAATKTNSRGLYVVTSLQPGTYRIIVSSPGFKQIVKPDVVLNVQDNVSLNFQTQVGSASETMTVTGGAPLVETQDATVSTVTDREFVANLPLNGRTLQNLIELTPGVSLGTVSNSGTTEGTFSVNGQRAASNAFSVDGVSANAGVSTTNFGGQEAAGVIPAFSALGTSANLVSIDALQEFRVQTSTYAPEFGRQPGGQITFSTRSGTNQFHGDVFDYFRNNYFDARDWFNQVQLGQPQAAERQNDFGGVLGGPLIKGRTFFFFSYEGLRLDQPFSGSTIVPSLASRQMAPPLLQPFLNLYPVPNGTVSSDGTALWNGSSSSPSNSDTYSLRLDHKIKDNLTVFARYNRSPSRVEASGFDTLTIALRTQTLTAGSTWTITSKLVNELRFNYTRNAASNSYGFAAVSGSVPLPASDIFPSPFTYDDAYMNLNPGSGVAAVSAGSLVNNLQRLYNLVDNLAYEKANHLIKYGVDYRHLSPVFGPVPYATEDSFSDFASFLAGSPLTLQTLTGAGGVTFFNNVGFYAQDTWKMTRHLTVTYGVRDDIDFAPSSGGPAAPLVAVTNINNLNTVAPQPAGTPIWNTRHFNFAPRVGVSYELYPSRPFEAVLRGGFGMFRDLVSQETGSAITSLSYPFGASNFFFCVEPGIPSLCPAGPLVFPPNPTEAAPVTIPASLPVPDFSAGTFFDPNIKMPYSYQWNLGLEQTLGARQMLSLEYVGSAGRQLLMQEGVVLSSNPNFPGGGTFLVNGGYSNYNSFQAQFVRRLSAGLQARVNYTWAHSLDNASVASSLFADNYYFPEQPNLNRGDSDFDVHHTFSAALSGDLPYPSRNTFLRNLLDGWGTDNVVLARSATPIDVTVNSSLLSFGETDTGLGEAVRPDLVPGTPVFLTGSQFPGGKELNSAAFALPPQIMTALGPVAAREGTLGRNALRGFTAFSWDTSLRRDFKLPRVEGAKLQLRCDVFNVLNHPNFIFSPLNLSTSGGFAPPGSPFVNPLFGQVDTTLANGVGQAFSGNLTSLYGFGANRSMQIAAKLVF